ncbi:MAG: SOUL family heme-binding protein [Methanobacterium sp.]
MTETLTYEIEKKDGDFEIRRYGEHVVAHVDVEAPFDEAMGIGFRILAHYIFGGNKKRSSIEMTVPVEEEKKSSEKIPMTAPVTEESLQKSEKIKMTTPVTEEETGNVHRISFVMPSKYTLETLPEPEDDQIKFEEVKEEKMAALRFKGRVKEKLAAEKIEEMKKWLKDNDIHPKSNFIVAQYNNPAGPGFLRRNEILVEIG